MFGKRSGGNEPPLGASPAPLAERLAAAVPVVEAPRPQSQKVAKPAPAAFKTLSFDDDPAPPIVPQRPSVMDGHRSDGFYETKGQIFGALIEAIDLSQLSKLDPLAAREEIRDIVNEIIAIKNVV